MPSHQPVAPRKATLRDVTACRASIRARLSVLATFCFAMALTPQADAQCGSNIAVPANQWSMVGVPCEPPGPPGNTAAAFFGPSLNPAAAPPTYAYNVTWVLYRKGYGPADCGSASDPNNCYVKLAATDAIGAGDAFWLYTTQAATIDFSGLGASNTVGQNTPIPPGPNFAFPGIQAESNANPRYYMFANPFEATVAYNDFRWTGLLFFFFPVNEATSAAVNSSVITGIAHYWNGNTYSTRSYNGLDPATFEPKEAAWLEFLQGVSPFIANLTVHVPDPTP